jgi:uncharacterized phage-like protein YoqJ
MANQEKSGHAKVEKQNLIDSIESFAEDKAKTVIWKTPEGIEQLNSVVEYKKNNPDIAIKTLVEFLKEKCEWNYTNRYIFDIIVTKLEQEDGK